MFTAIANDLEGGWNDLTSSVSNFFSLPSNVPSTAPNKPAEPIKVSQTKTQIKKVDNSDIKKETVVQASTAQKIIDTKKVKFAEGHTSGVVDNANAKQNINDAANNEKMATSKYGHAGGKKTALNENAAKAFLVLAGKYKMTVSEIAGGKHGGGNSLHYEGKAIDINYINEMHATINNKDLKDFVKDAQDLGFTVIAPPAEDHDTHVHLQWGTRAKPKK